MCDESALILRVQEKKPFLRFSYLPNLSLSLRIYKLFFASDNYILTYKFIKLNLNFYV